MESFQVIKEIYETMNIYRSVLVYIAEKDFKPLRDILMENDYPLVNHAAMDTAGRMYCVYGDDPMIEWDTISVVFALGDNAYDMAKRIVLEKRLEEYILLVKI